MRPRAIASAPRSVTLLAPEAASCARESPAAEALWSEAGPAIVRAPAPRPTKTVSSVTGAPSCCAERGFSVSAAAEARTS